jgi:hypothetical protein
MYETENDNRNKTFPCHSSASQDFQGGLMKVVIVLRTLTNRRLMGQRSTAT